MSAAATRPMNQQINSPERVKRGNSPFLIFLHSEGRSRFQQRFPHLWDVGTNKVRKGNYKEFTKFGGEQWRAMSDEEKQPFKDMAKSDRERYQAESAVHARNATPALVSPVPQPRMVAQVAAHDYKEIYIGELSWLRTQVEAGDRLSFWEQGGSSSGELSWLRTTVSKNDQTDKWKEMVGWLSEEEYHRQWCAHPGDLTKATELKERYENQPSLPSFLEPMSRTNSDDEESDEEDEVEVIIWNVNGREVYVDSNNGDVYDPETSEHIGTRLPPTAHCAAAAFNLTRGDDGYFLQPV